MKKEEFERRLFLKSGRQFQLNESVNDISLFQKYKFDFYPNVVLESNKKEVYQIPYFLISSDWCLSSYELKINRFIVSSIIKNLGEQTYSQINIKSYKNIFVTDSTVIIYANNKCFLRGKRNKFYKLLIDRLLVLYPKDKYVYLIMDKDDYELKLKLI